jgi:thiamine monophosphate synthase
VILAPVFPTRSKPGAPALGIDRFAQLAAASPAPVYALGGVDRTNFALCLDAGAAGIAAISAFDDEDGVELVREGVRWTRRDRINP